MYEQGSSGRSGGLFFYTRDRRYMLKTLSKREFFKLRDILKDYISHIQQNPDSLLIKFLGMYQMEWTDP
jgi:1-phosphatidylinositol-4-phosphate 5-kinase